MSSRVCAPSNGPRGGVPHRRYGSNRRRRAALIDHVAAWAADHGLRAVTLTTFRHVPGNAPYYGRLGVEVLTDIGLELAARVDEETAHGLDPALRVCMRRPLS